MLEMITAQRINELVEAHNILGYQHKRLSKGISTTHTILHFTTKIRNHITSSKKEGAVAAFIVFRAANDNASHPIFSSFLQQPRLLRP